jgi:hypothetical protein
MKTRAVLVFAALSAAAVATPGWASPAAPEPTASVATYVQGRQLPASVATASWSNVAPGCAGDLTFSGPTVTGTTTVARGALTSRWFRPRGGVLLSVFGAQGGNNEWQPFAQGFDIKVRVRAKGRSWSPWMGTGARIAGSSVPGVLFQVSMGVGMTLGEISQNGRPLPLQQVQTRLVDTVTSTGTVDDRFTVKMGC